MLFLVGNKSNPHFAHWIWGPDGWIALLGVIDFAGGTVVHISAGFAALVAAIILGPRSKKNIRTEIPHNIPFVILGASLLWFGWYGFNAGSALVADGLTSLVFKGIDISEHGEKAYEYDRLT